MREKVANFRLSDERKLSGVMIYASYVNGGIHKQIRDTLTAASIDRTWDRRLLSILQHEFRGYDYRPVSLLRHSLCAAGLN